ncbi:MAG: urea ABC transporter permease subunit UrtB, partial [Bauldia sp.]|nr:urea ABC transporter permease subunit UrtB [Bauldia sp.]
MRILIQVVLAALICLAATLGVKAQGADLRELVNGLAVGGYDETETQIAAIAATGDPAAVPVLEALAEGNVYSRKSDKLVFIAEKTGSTYKLIDPLTGEVVEEVGSGAITKIKVNNRLRRAIRTALGALTLMSPNPDIRRAAAEAIFLSGDPDAIELIDQAIEQETVPAIAKLMREARAAAVLKSDLSDDEKVAAIEVIKSRSGRDSLSLLIPLTEVEGPVGDAARSAVSAIEGELALWDIGQNVWYGLSLGSVLLLAAIGLAITFGVMGVINMAHGEMVMIGAYTTFVVQEIIRNNAPWLFDSSLFIAIPLAFLVAGAIGVAIERGVIRFLYGRPLETLLATWGISLILQQA